MIDRKEYERTATTSLLVRLENGDLTTDQWVPAPPSEPIEWSAIDSDVKWSAGWRP